MIIFIAISSFIFIYTMTFYYIIRNEDYTMPMNIIVSFFDTLVVTFMLYLTVMYGFVFEFFTVLVALFGALIIMYFRLKNEDDHTGSSEFRYEGIKNTYLMYTTSVIPFFISMTVFRYLPGILQILLSLAISYAVYKSGKYIRKISKDIYYAFRFKIRTDGIRKFAYIWSIFGLILVLAFLFDTPKNEINSLFNLNNHRPIYNFSNGYPIDLKVNFETVKLEEIESDSQISFNYPLVGYEAPYTQEFEISKYAKFFDGDIEYEAYVVNFNFTRYIKTYPNGLQETYEINGVHNTRGFVSGDTIYLVGNEIIEIMDGEFAINAIYNLQPKTSFWAISKYHDFSMVGAKIVDEKLEFTTIEMKQGTRIYNTYHLSEVDIDIDLPFYSHYSSGFMIFVFIMTIFPITYYKKHITIVDINSKYNISKDTD